MASNIPEKPHEQTLFFLYSGLRADEILLCVRRAVAECSRWLDTLFAWSETQCDIPVGQARFPNEGHMEVAHLCSRYWQERMIECEDLLSLYCEPFAPSSTARISPLMQLQMEMMRMRYLEMCTRNVNQTLAQQLCEQFPTLAVYHRQRSMTCFSQSQMRIVLDRMMHEIKSYRRGEPDDIERYTLFCDLVEWSLSRLFVQDHPGDLLDVKDMRIPVRRIAQGDPADTFRINANFWFFCCNAMQRIRGALHFHRALLAACPPLDVSSAAVSAAAAPEDLLEVEARCKRALTLAPSLQRYLVDGAKTMPEEVQNSLQQAIQRKALFPGDRTWFNYTNPVNDATEDDIFKQLHPKFYRVFRDAVAKPPGDLITLTPGILPELNEARDLVALYQFALHISMQSQTGIRWITTYYISHSDIPANVVKIMNFNDALVIQTFGCYYAVVFRCTTFPCQSVFHALALWITLMMDRVGVDNYLMNATLFGNEMLNRHFLSSTTTTTTTSSARRAPGAPAALLTF